MSAERIAVALIRDVFHGEGAADRLAGRLSEAKRRGADLAVLPELPLNAWAPAGKTPREEDAERPHGPRHQLLSEAARSVGIGVLGGAIVRDPSNGARHNCALTFNRRGELIDTYQKLHLPEEEGFWETSHYEPGATAYSVIGDFGMPFGVQICSDINRPAGSHILAALGAEAVLAPRATERATYERWEVVFRANAITSTAYIVSVNRPGPESGIGGPSVVVGPRGEVLLKTLEPVAVTVLKRKEVKAARHRYPGYLPVRAQLYSRQWARVGNSDSP